MATSDWATPKSNSNILIQSAILSLMIESAVIIGFGQHEHWMVHPKKEGLDEKRFIETEMIQLPERPHLVEKKISRPPPPKPETVLSKTPGQGKPNKDISKALEEENKTEIGPPPVALTHGVLVIYSPAPVLPPYLETQDIKTTVLIDFFVDSRGIATPKLVGGSQNEEINAIALTAVKKWQFKPAEKDGNPIDSKVRLRINFEVK